MQFTDFTYEELREFTPTVQAVLIPLGCTEQQGPHMQVSFDTMMVTQLCLDMAEALDAQGSVTLVMPAMPFGPTPEHRDFGHGYVNLRQSTHEAIVLDILNSLAEQGFRRLLVWRGCGQHELGLPIDEFNASSLTVRAYQPLADYGSICDIVLGPSIPGGHADSFATSIGLHLNERTVRLDRVPPASGTINWQREMDFAAVSSTGVLGDPNHASKTNGQRLWELCVQEGVRLVKSIIRGEPVRESWHFKDGL